MPLLGSLHASVVVARDLFTDREKPCAHETPVFVVSETPIHHQEDLLQGVIDVCDRHTEPAQAAPHEICLVRKYPSDLCGKRIVAWPLNRTNHSFSG
jgi:hypothetical protein